MTNHIIIGALVVTSFLAGMYFLRFWKQTRDRFFLFFAVAFWVMAVNWTGLAFTDPANEVRPYFYALRLVAFLSIIAAIWDKNRPRRA